VAYLNDRLPAGVPAQLALRRMHTADLYLACACAHGDVNGFAAFDDHCLHRLDGVLRRLGADADQTEELKQNLRSRVLVGSSGRALIIEFSGRGDLRGWVRTIAIREVLRAQHRARREVPLDDD